MANSVANNSMTFVQVHGTYLDTTGSPVSGTVVFNSQQTFVLDGELVVVPATVEAELDANGYFTANLAMTDGNYSSQGWTYAVQENFSGGRTFNIIVPANTVTIDLANYGPSVPAPLVFKLATVARTGDFNDLINRPSFGPGSSFSAVAAVPISSGQVVAVDDSGAFIPDLTVPAQVIQIAGIATTSAVAGNPISILPAGTMSENLWHWNIGPVYCATQGGTITQTIQTTGAIQQVGFATSLNTLEVNIYPAILL